jgi:2-hydroxychromene-2-carboxylate isomerase
VIAAPRLLKATWRQGARGYNEQVTSQNALANVKRLFKALAAKEANLDEPIPDIRITDVAEQIGLEGDEFDSALDYAADQGWFEDAEMGDSASWVSLTPAGVAAAKS